MDGVPKQVRMMRFDGTRAVRNGRAEFADVGFFQFHEAVVKAIGGRGEDRHAGLFGQAKYFENVVQRTGQRLVDEERLFGGNHRARLFEMGASIDAFEQHAIHIPAQIVDRGFEFHAVILLNLRREILHPISAARNIGAEGLERRHYLRSRDMLRKIRLIEHLRELDDVRSVEADNSDAEIIRARTLEIAKAARLPARKARVFMRGGRVSQIQPRCRKAS